MTEGKKVVLERITEKGPITFEEFMELALYHPRHGYYTRPGQKIGRGGDYYTSVHVSKIFGQSIGRQLIEMGFILGWEELKLVEYGAGEGYLALDILETLWQELPRWAGKIPYYICEESEYHRRQQKHRLEAYLNQVYWIEEPGDINQGRPFKGIVFSNELVDAFPVHRVKQIGGRLQEIYIGYEQGSLVEKPGELSTPVLGEYFPFLGFKLQEGQEAEINLRALRWLQEVSLNLERGFVLTIDYGYEVNELANPRRFDGTVMCYYQHRADTNPLDGIGLKDITSHVNFTALMEYGREYGLEVTGFTNQMKFLVGLEAGKELENQDLSPAEKQKLSLALKELLMPDKMGERFQVLIQHKGLSEKPVLSGLKGFSSW
ncbi:MAG: SAM-dependent methyltransferase [Clostridia bacterium]|nr:SAM-dependent methyltransferase [Clostridia bacterium]